MLTNIERLYKEIIEVHMLEQTPFLCEVMYQTFTETHSDFT